jgi:hypothetical protein
MCGFGNETPAFVATVSLGLGSIDIDQVVSATTDNINIDQVVSATTDNTVAKVTIVRMTPTSIVNHLLQ